jgi:hypothetical protein
VAFTQRTVTHVFLNGDLTAASGSVAFVLDKLITNDGTSLIPLDITSSLDGSGNLSQSLTCNTDADTLPTDSQWRVDITLAGALSTQTYYVSVPPGIGPIDLFSLIPGTQQVG